ncbi:DUF2852 domain-containing protein [Bradyrhizobium diazoefficiens]|nr:DUF2852 domain-containing protein [Bradyrhizobium diazoefficiens]MBR0852229.1 DUF2852 domain-containing protein [Bradyrhizobium diazoefficiens]
MWWYGCSTAPWMFFGPIMMMIFILACIGMMFLFMRRHPGLGTLSANGGPAMRLGPWRNLAREDAPTSAAFEEYRRETLRQLEREQTEFKSFLEQLQSAKDKAEFDQFMRERQSGIRNSA